MDCSQRVVLKQKCTVFRNIYLDGKKNIKIKQLNYTLKGSIKAMKANKKGGNQIDFCELGSEFSVQFINKTNDYFFLERC